MLQANVKKLQYDDGGNHFKHFPSNVPVLVPYSSRNADLTFCPKLQYHLVKEKSLRVFLLLRRRSNRSDTKPMVKSKTDAKEPPGLRSLPPSPTPASGGGSIWRNTQHATPRVRSIHHQLFPRARPPVHQRSCRDIAGKDVIFVWAWRNKNPV